MGVQSRSYARMVDVGDRRGTEGEDGTLTIQVQGADRP